MIALEEALADLGEHLDHPAGDDLAGDVRATIAAGEEPHNAAGWSSTRSRLLAAAAIAALIALAVAAYAPTREAVADWLGIGAVDVNRSDEPPRPEGDHPVPGAPGASTGALSLAGAQARVGFEILTPPGAELRGVEVDDRIPDGLVVLDYGGFTLFEVASQLGQEPWLSKTVPEGGRVEPALVDGRPALWISGTPHEIAFYDRDGQDQYDTIRQAGPVLVWERDGVTYRIEGFTSRAEAIAVAESLS